MPLITKPTRITHPSCTLTDNIFTDDNCSSTGGLVSTDISDHEALFLLDTTTLHLNKLQVKSRCTRPENMSRLKSKLLDYDFSEIVNNSDTLTAFSGFFSIFDTLINQNLPLKTVNIKPKLAGKPWYTLGFQTSNNVKIKLYRKQQSKPTLSNIETYKNIGMGTITC